MIFNPPNIINDLTTGGATNALSAEQGKLLNAAVARISAYDEVAAVDDEFAIDFEGLPFKNVIMEIEDTDGKEVTVDNVPTICELFIVLKVTEEVAVTWFDGIDWLTTGTAPVLEEGKIYRMAFFTMDGGTNWHGNCAGGWEDVN